MPPIESAGVFYRRLKSCEQNSELLYSVHCTYVKDPNNALKLKEKYGRHWFGN